MRTALNIHAMVIVALFVLLKIYTRKRIPPAGIAARNKLYKYNSMLLVRYRADSEKPLAIEFIIKLTKYPQQYFFQYNEME